MKKHQQMQYPRGTIHRFEFISEVLKDNPLGDPAKRTVSIYTPPNYNHRLSYPLFVDLAGYTSSGLARLNWKPFGLNTAERLDALQATGKMGPVICLFPDCFTSLGGNQYINSMATGRYMDYLIDELIPFVESTFSVEATPEKRAVFGKSSGGYGALMHGMLRSKSWGGIASHAGDAYFEYGYLPDFPKALTTLLKHGGDARAFLEDVWSKEKLSYDEGMTLLTLGLAAHYDPAPGSELGFHLPFDTHTGKIISERWQQWLRSDPVRVVDQAHESLASLKGIYIDCGDRDQYNLLWGARMLHQKLDSYGIKHRYEEFAGNHSDIDYRLDESLPFLYQALCTKTEESS